MSTLPGVSVLGCSGVALKRLWFSRSQSLRKLRQPVSQLPLHLRPLHMPKQITTSA